eukprot:5380427-Amphidinium_carterae.1
MLPPRQTLNDPFAARLRAIQSQMRTAEVTERKALAREMWQLRRQKRLERSRQLAERGVQCGYVPKPRVHHCPPSVFADTANQNLWLPA